LAGGTDGRGRCDGCGAGQQRGGEEAGGVQESEKREGRGGGGGKREACSEEQRELADARGRDDPSNDGADRGRGERSRTQAGGQADGEEH
jgi:hypothetical protein